MGFFKREKTNYVGEMQEYLKNFMIQYIKEYPSASDDVIPIFSNAQLMIQGLSEKEINKTIKTNHINIECATLNIIQNFAMTELHPKDPKNFLIGEDHPYELYKYVNDIKYKKGYISKQQYDDNAMLAIKLSLNPPLGTWFYP